MIQNNVSILVINYKENAHQWDTKTDEKNQHENDFLEIDIWFSTVWVFEQWGSLSCEAE